jgi:hypothetical protein
MQTQDWRSLNVPIYMSTDGTNYGLRVFLLHGGSPRKHNHAILRIKSYVIKNYDFFTVFLTSSSQWIYEFPVIVLNWGGGGGT